MALSLYFYWDFLVTDTALNVVIEASHDEYLQVWSGDPQTFERCEALFTDFGLEKLDGPLP